MTSEAERQFYLSQMGVHLWYARDPLPGAAPSPDFDFSEPESDLRADTQEVVRSTPTVPRSAEDRAVAQDNVRDLLKSIGGKSGREESKPVPGPESESASSESIGSTESHSMSADKEPEARVDDHLQGLERAKLDIGFWVSGRYCLASNLSTDISEELQGELAANILSALGEKVDEHKRFVWPIFNNPAVMKHARKDLVFLLKRIEQQILVKRTLICLGQLAETEQQHETLLARIAESSVYGEHGLAALAADFRNKRRLWAILREEVLGGR